MKRAPTTWSQCLVLAALAILAFTPGTATAGQLSLGIGNIALAPFPPPYGTVDVGFVDATHATITLTGLTHDGFAYLFGDGSTLGLNFNGTVAVVGSITGTQPSDPF